MLLIKFDDGNASINEFVFDESKSKVVIFKNKKTNEVIIESYISLASGREIKVSTYQYLTARPKKVLLVLREGEDYTSQSIDCVTYDQSTNSIGIVFKNPNQIELENRNIYLYAPVTRRQVFELIMANSSNKYWRENIRYSKNETRMRYIDYIEQFQQTM